VNDVAIQTSIYRNIGTHGRDEICVQNLGGKLERKGPLGDLGLGRRVM